MSRHYHYSDIRRKVDLPQCAFRTGGLYAEWSGMTMALALTWPLLIDSVIDAGQQITGYGCSDSAYEAAEQRN